MKAETSRTIAGRLPGGCPLVGSVLRALQGVISSWSLGYQRGRCNFKWHLIARKAQARIWTQSFLQSPHCLSTLHTMCLCHVHIRRENTSHIGCVTPKYFNNEFMSGPHRLPGAEKTKMSKSRPHPHVPGSDVPTFPANLSLSPLPSSAPCRVAGSLELESDTQTWLLLKSVFVPTLFPSELSCRWPLLYKLPERTVTQCVIGINYYAKKKKSSGSMYEDLSLAS